MDQQQLQSLVQELQMVRGQIQSLTSQFNEISLTIEALNQQSPEKSVYRALGGVLLEVDDRDHYQMICWLLKKQLSLTYNRLMRGNLRLFRHIMKHLSRSNEW